MVCILEALHLSRNHHCLMICMCHDHDHRGRILSKMDELYDLKELNDAFFFVCLRAFLYLCRENIIQSTKKDEKIYDVSVPFGHALFTNKG